MEKKYTIIDWWMKNHVASLSHVKMLSDVNNILPVIGSGMSVSYGYPTWSDFLKEMTELTSSRINTGDPTYAKIQTSIDQFNIKTNNALVGKIKKRFSLEHMELSLRYKDSNIDESYIALLKRKGINYFVTTNYDPVIETLYHKLSGHKLAVTYLNKKGKIVNKKKEYEPQVFKLHGSSDIEDSLITMDAQSYGETYRNQGIIRMMELMCKKKTLLFLGCGFPEDPFYKKLEEIAGGVEKFSHYAIVQKPRDKKTEKLLNIKLTKLRICPIYYPESEHEYIFQILSLLSDSILLEKYLLLKSMIGEMENDELNRIANDLNEFAYVANKRNCSADLFKVLINENIHGCQVASLDTVCSLITEEGKSILIEGTQGAGKSVLLSLLYLKIISLDDKPKSFFFKLDNNCTSFFDACKQLVKKKSAEKYCLFVDGITPLHMEYDSIVKKINNLPKNIVTVCSYNKLDSRLVEVETSAKFRNDFVVYTLSPFSVDVIKRLELLKTTIDSALLQKCEDNNKLIIDTCRDISGNQIVLSTILDIIRASKDEQTRNRQAIIDRFYLNVSSNKNIADFTYTCIQIAKRITCDPKQIIANQDRHIHNASIMYLMFATGYYLCIDNSCNDILNYILPYDFNKALINYAFINNNYEILIRNIEYERLSFTQKLQYVYILGRVANKEKCTNIIIKLFEELHEIIQDGNYTLEDCIIYRNLGLCLAHMKQIDLFDKFYSVLSKSDKLREVNMKFYCYYYSLMAPKNITADEVKEFELSKAVCLNRVAHLRDSIASHLRKNNKTNGRNINACRIYINILTLETIRLFMLQKFSEHDINEKIIRLYKKVQYKDSVIKSFVEYFEDSILPSNK